MQRNLLVLILSICISVIGQAQTISGTVVSAKDGESLVGVNIVEKTSSRGIVTDINGQFSIDANLPCELQVSCIGFLDMTVTVDSYAPLKISLEEDTELLEEVLVVGYGVQKKKLVTGSTVQVKGEDIQKMNTVNPLGALQSQTPGINITQTSGMPGEGFKVTIRGLGTVGSAAPLYIIDGSAGGDINNLNPADIESIDVLKDAASAAIYGSRAANGVVLVTTKQGHADRKAEVSLDAYYGFQNVYKMPDILNAQEYVAIMNETRLSDGLPIYDWANEIPDWADVESGKNKGTNWLDYSRKKNAPVQNYALNISGGNRQSVYSIGLSYANQQGILGYPVQPNYNRYTARINSEHTAIRSGDLDILKIGENITYSYSTRTGISIWDMWDNDIRNLIKANPLLPMFDENGDYHTSIPYDVKMANPVAVMEKRASNISKSHDLKANIFLTIQPVKNLVFKTNLGYVLHTSSYRSYMPKYALSTVSQNGIESVSQSMNMGYSLTWENTLTYSHSVGNHNLSYLIGQSIENNAIGESLSASNANPQFHDLKHAYIDNAPLSALTNATAMSGSAWGRSALASFFGRINYDYKNKYMLTAVLRADGSSVFARGHRWGIFPSVSAGWTLTEEDFMKPAQDVVSFMKIRASWGQNGNQDIAPFQYLATISKDASYIFGGDKATPSIGSYPDILANPDLTWETSQQFDLGLDMRFFQSRLGLTFDYYIKDTKDWLVVAPQLASYGTGAPYINGGDVRNTGVELALGWNDEVGDFRYGINANMSWNRNKITRLANSEGIIHGPVDVLFQGSDECYRAEVGYPIGFFYGYKTAGVFQNQAEVDNYQGAKLPGAREGDLIWVDTDGNGEINELDRTMIGDPHPDVYLGGSLSFGWKGLDLSMTLNGAFGHQIMKSYRSWSDSPKENHTSDVFGRWHGEGTSNRLPRLSSNYHTNWGYVSDIYVQDGDFMRIQNLTLGYDFKSLIKSNAIGQLRVYVSAQNLYTFTKYTGMDPEVGYGGADEWSSGIDLGFYPSPRTWIVGLNIKF